MKINYTKIVSGFDMPSLSNKTVVITGGNSGIGLMSAKYFAYLKANVIITVRNIEKGKQAIAEIKNEIPDAKISMMQLDMSHEQSIKDFVHNIIRNNIDIDIFYHNAGVYRIPFELVENKDIITSTNYFGQIILSSLLIPYLHSLKHAVVMAFTSSVAALTTNNKKVSIHPNEKISKIQRYSDSKLLDAFLFKYLNDYDTKNIKYFLVHPGVTNTGLIQKAYKGKMTNFFIKIYMALFSNPLWKSSLSILCCVNNNAINGTFYGPNKLFHFVGKPKKCKFLDKKYKNVENVIKESEKIVGYKLLD